MIDRNIVIIILLCITFIILFQGITYFFETYMETFTEYESPSMSPSMSPSSITKEIIVGEVYPKSNMIDASNMRIRLDRLTEIFNKLENLSNKIIEPKLKLTYDYKEPGTSKDQEQYDISISGDQTIHVDVPIGSKGIQGIKGEKGNKGPIGEQGEIGPVGYCGLSIC